MSIHFPGVPPGGRSSPPRGQQPKTKKFKPNRKKKRYRPGGLIGCPVAVREEPPAAAESLAGARTAAWSAPARSATGEQAVLSAVPVSSLRA